MDVHLLDTVSTSSKRRDWAWERFGWFVMAVVVALAIIGLFGGGPVAWEETVMERESGEYKVRYETWNRYSAVSAMIVTTHAPQVEGDELRITFDRALGTGITLRSSSPASDGGELGPEGQVYVFKVDGWSRPVVVNFEYLPQRMGSWEGDILVEAGDAPAVRVPVVQRVFP